MRVLESDLPPSLKPVAVTMALFGNDAGDRIYPGVDRVAHLLGVKPRSVRRQLSALRQLGVLMPQSETTGGRLEGGRGRSVVYHLDADALPSRPSYKPGRSRQRSCEPCFDTRRGVGTLPPKAATLTHENRTLTPNARYPDAGVTRSSREIFQSQRERENVNIQTYGADAPCSLPHENQDQNPRAGKDETGFTSVRDLDLIAMVARTNPRFAETLKRDRAKRTRNIGGIA
jgi:hypothetical protein